MRDVIAGLDDRARGEFLEALQAEGLGPAGIARILSKMATGYREIIGPDAAQLRKALESLPESKTKYWPKVVELEDGRQVIRVDAATQMRALKMLTDIYGLTSSGLNVVNNVGASAVAGTPPPAIEDGTPETKDLGDALTSGHRPPAISRIRNAVRSLPPAARRAVLEELLGPAQELIEATATSSTSDGGTTEPESHG